MERFIPSSSFAIRATALLLLLNTLVILFSFPLPKVTSPYELYAYKIQDEKKKEIPGRGDEIISNKNDVTTLGEEKAIEKSIEKSIVKSTVKSDVQKSEFDPDLVNSVLKEIDSLSGNGKANEALSFISSLNVDLVDSSWEILDRKGRILQTSNKLALAAESYEKAYELCPFDNDRSQMMRKLISIYDKTKHYSGKSKWARVSYQQAPSLSGLISLIKACMKSSDWETWEVDAEKMVKEIKASYYTRGSVGVDVFTALHFGFNVSEINGFNSLASRGVKARAHASGGSKTWDYTANRAHNSSRIRIGYVSHDLRLHSVGLVVQSMFGFHDRSRFEAFCYFVHDKQPNPNRKDSIYQKIRSECEHFVELGGPLSTADGMKRIHDDEIDIMVDMMIYTAGHRMDLFPLHPAPITVAWLGLGCSTGADFIDYLIADPTTVPEKYFPYYPEKIVHMPFTYHIADHKQFYGLPPDNPDRKPMGLREDSFVFCNFANVIRWSPISFNVWCNIVKRVPGSALMMRNANDHSAENLAKEAKKRGLRVNMTHPLESDLVLMKKEDLPIHIEKKVACDLNLDTIHYNGHSMGLDLTWAGTPLVTFPQQTIASRAAASFSKAAYLPVDNIASSWQEYEDIAVRIALDKKGYKEMNDKLHRERPILPLFDTKRWVRNFENAAEQMYQRWLRGEPPDHITVVDQGVQE